MLEKGMRKIFYGLLVLEILCVLLAFWTNAGYVHKAVYDVCTPNSVQKSSDGSEEYRFNVKEMGREQETVVFFSHQQFVEVFQDGEVVYSALKDGGVWGHTPGSGWNFVPIRNGAKELVVKLTPAYDSVKFEKCTFYKGQELDVFMKIFQGALPAFAASAIIIVLGIALVASWIVIEKRVKIGNSLLYLGIFSIVFGLWSMNETDVAFLCIRNRVGAYFLSYILLMMLEVPFVLFTKEFLNVGDKKIWKALCGLSVAENIVVLTLHFGGIRELKETLFLTYIVLCAGMLYMLGCLIYKVMHHEMNNRVRVSMAGILFVALVGLLNIVSYYLHTGNTDLFGRFLFLLFILLVTWETITESVVIMEKGRKAAEYQHLADIDALTGVFSRSSYERDIQNMVLNANIMIVSFDLNNLKLCNDKYGHKMGDEYLLSASSLIAKIFQKYGKIYRIGGDEFCCIIEKAKECPIKYCIQQMAVEEAKIEKGRKGHPYKVRVACGYAVYDPGKDENLEATRERSDIMMYRNKEEIKGKEKNT